MKYHLFVWHMWEAIGGMRDYAGVYDSVEEARAAMLGERCEYGQIVRADEHTGD